MPRRAFPPACPPAVLLLLGLTRPAAAQNPYYPADTTIRAAIPYANVGYANQADYDRKANRTSPTFTLVSGGSVQSILAAYNSSKVILKGGRVGRDVIAFENSVVTIQAGSIGGSLNAYGSSVVTVSGGSIRKSLLAGQNATLNLIGTGLGKTPVRLNSADGPYNQYTLSGALSDGTNLNGVALFVDKKGGAKVNFLKPASHSAPGTRIRQGRRL